MGKKKKIPDWMKEFDETYHWSKDKGFYGHMKPQKIKKVKIRGC